METYTTGYQSQDWIYVFNVITIYIKSIFFRTLTTINISNMQVVIYFGNDNILIIRDIRISQIAYETFNDANKGISICI